MFTAVRKWYRRRTLTFKLGVSISVCVLIGVAWLWYYLSAHSRPIIKAHIESLARQPLQDAVKDLEATGWETESAAFTIKNTLKELPSTDVEMMRHLLNSALQTLIHDESDAAHAWVYVFENEDVTTGTMYSAIMDDGKFQFKSTQMTDFYRLYPWFKAVPKEEAVFWSEPYVAESFDTESPVVTCLIPFKFLGSDKFDGLVAVSMDLDVIRNDFAKIEQNSIGKFWVTSPQGKFVIHPDSKLQSNITIQELAAQKKWPQLQKAYDDILQGKSGNIEIKASTVYDSAVMVLYAPISDTGWGVGLVCSKKEFVEPLRDLQIKTMSFMLLWLAGLLLIINFIFHRSTKPLYDLSKVAIQYGEGNFEATLPENMPNDEIGVMNDAFHKMRDNLLQHIELVKKAAGEKQRAKSELEIAQKIQQSALPVEFPFHESFEIYAYMTAAKKVGGDFYDFFYTDENHVAVVIADVSGKGIPAALYMMNAKALIRSTAKSGVSLTEVFGKVNNELCRGGGDLFVTAFMAVLDLRNGELHYVNAGHNPPCYRGKDGYKMMEVKRNIVLGGIENILFSEEKLQMQEGDRMFLYTDGVNEAQNKAGEFYGNERMMNMLNRPLQSPYDVLLTIKDDIAVFADGAEQSDDLTMLELVYCALPKGALTVKAEVKFIDTVLGYVENDMEKNNVPPQQQSRIMVATEEIFSNEAQYAYHSHGLVRIYSYIKDGSYHLCFTDNGVAYNPQERKTPDLSGTAEQRNIGGLGIYLVKELTDDVKYKRDKDLNILDISIKI